ncbi:MAG: peptidylprolyl isomerase, partial [Candidatus Sumerlaeota bacterium]
SKDTVALTNNELAMTRTQMVNEMGNLFGGPTEAQGLLRELNDEQVFPMEDIERRAIQRWYLQQQADKMDIVVTDNELLGILQELFAGYAKAEINDFLRSMGYSDINSYLESLRQSQRLERATYAYTSQAKASYYELWDAYRLNNEERQMDFVSMQPADFRDQVEPTEEELADFFANNREMFEVGTQRIYEYAYMMRSDLRDQVDEPTEEQIENYYERNQDKYQHDRMVKVRAIRIPIELSDDMTPQQREAATSKSLELAQNLAELAREKDTDFAELANKHSREDANTTPTQNGGLVSGWVSQERWMELGWAFTNTAVKLEEGQVSNPVRNQTRSGSHFAIIKATDVREPGILSLEEAKERVVRDWRNSRLEEIFDEKYNELNMKVAEFTTLESLAKELNMKDGTSTWVLTSNPVISEEIFMEPEDLEYVNENLLENQLSPLFISRNTIFILFLKEERPPHVPPYKQVRERVVEAYTDQKSLELAKTAAEDFMSTVTASDFKTTATAQKLGVQQTDFFNRNEPPDTFPAPLYDLTLDTYEVTTGTIGMSEGGTEDEVRAYVVWHINSLQTPTREKFIEDLPQIQRSIMISQQTGILNEWLWDKMQMTKILPREDELQ